MPKRKPNLSKLSSNARKKKRARNTETLTIEESERQLPQEELESRRREDSIRKSVSRQNETSEK